MAFAAISLAMVCISLGQSVSCSGTFYQKVSDDGDDTSVTTKYFHQCSIMNNCNYVGIPLDNADNNVYSAATMHDLEVTGKKLQTWKKVKLDDSSRDDTSNAKVIKSCKVAKETGVKENGIVKVSLTKNAMVDLYCNMITDGGGWIVFQKRVSRNINFHRNWEEYEKGFGDLNASFWLGLKTLHDLTSKGKWTLRVDLKRINGEKGYAKYTGFKIGSREEKYKLVFDKNSYTGNIGNALNNHHGMFFTTWDKDNDARAGGNCASMVKGGWWINRCYAANLNNYYPGETTGEFLMMTWKTWKDTFGDIDFSEMKIREDD